MPYLWCTYVWNMFDFAADAREEAGDPGKNHKGLVTYDRKTRKDAFYVYKARWSREPFVHLAGSRYVFRHEATTSIRVYTNLPKVALYVDQKLFAEQEGRYFFSFEVPISGRHLIEARAEGCSDTIEIEHVEKPYEGYRCQVKQGAVNWLDGCSEEGFVVTDRIGDLLAVPEGKEFLNAFFAYGARPRGGRGAHRGHGGLHRGARHEHGGRTPLRTRADPHRPRPQSCEKALKRVKNRGKTPPNRVTVW